MFSRSRSGADGSAASWVATSYGSTTIPSSSSSSSSQPPSSIIRSSPYYSGATPAGFGGDQRGNNHLPPWHNSIPRQNSSARFFGSQPGRTWSPSEGILIIRPSHNMIGTINLGGRDRSAAPGMSMNSQFLPPPQRQRFVFLDRTYTTNEVQPQNGPDQYSSSSSTTSDSRLTKPEQDKALNKLTKQIYGPNPKTLVKNLGLYCRDMGRPNNKKSKPAHQNNNSNKVDDEDGKRCAVCLEDFEPGTEVMVTPCKHMFHEECIVPWVKSNGQCPVCRFVLCEPSGRGISNGGGTGWSERDVVRMNRRRMESAMNMMITNHQRHHNHHRHSRGDMFADHLIDIIRAMEEASVWQRQRMN